MVGLKKEDLEQLVYSWPTKYKEGFLAEEEKELLSKFKSEQLNMNKWDSAMIGNTCMMKPEGIITYHCDVLTALKCALEDRDMYWYEWD